jgi:hypothetical protein
VYGGDVAATYARYLPRIAKAVSNDLITVLRRVNPSLALRSGSDSELGQVKDFGTIATASQAEGKPMKDVSVGTQDQRNDAEQVFLDIAHKIIASTSRV